MTDSETLYCPHCGHDGTFDGLGARTREYKRHRATSDGTITEAVHDAWAGFHCIACGTEFQVLEDRETVELEGLFNEETAPEECADDE